MSDRKVDAVLVVPFGAKKGRPSANWRLGARAIHMACKLGVPLLAHELIPVWEIVQEAQIKKGQLPTMHHIGGKTVYGIASAFYVEAGWEIWRKIMVIAPTPIAKRYLRDLKRVSGQRFEFVRETALDTQYDFEWFQGNRDDEQFFVRHPKWSAICEWLLTFVPWKMYRRFVRARK